MSSEREERKRTPATVRKQVSGRGDGTKNDRKKKSLSCKNKLSVIHSMRLTGAVRVSRPSDLVSRSQKQREAVRRFRQREKDRMNETLETIDRMKREIHILNSTIDQVDEDMDLLRELLAIHQGHQLRRRLEARITASQSSTPSHGLTITGPSGRTPAQRHQPQTQAEDQMEENVCDLSQLLSSPNDLEKMAKLVRYDATPASRSS